MTNPANAFLPAIEALEKDLGDLERQGNALLTSINVLRAKAGMPPRPGSFASGSGEPMTASTSTTALTLRSDVFVGKKMGSAAREYLEMRKAGGGDAPATIREIFDAMKDGGFDFKSKDDTNAIIVLRAMIRKNSSMFHRLQNGKYGLCSWYGPNLKPPKERPPNKFEQMAEEDETGDAGEDESEAADTGKASAA